MVNWYFPRVLIDQGVGRAVDDLVGSNADSASDPLGQTGLSSAEIADEGNHIPVFQSFTDILTDCLCFFRAVCLEGFFHDFLGEFQIHPSFVFSGFLAKYLTHVETKFFLENLVSSLNPSGLQENGLVNSSLATSH